MFEAFIADRERFTKAEKKIIDEVLQDDAEEEKDDAE